MNRKRLKRPDALLNRLQALYKWVEDNLKTVAVAAVVLFVALAAGISINEYNESKEEKALTSFYKAKKIFDEKSKESKELSKLDQEIFALKAVTQAHPNTKAALLSYLLLAKVYKEDKKLPEAKGFYEQALKMSKHKFYKILSLYNLGYISEKSGNCTEAVDWFKKITEYKKQRILLWTVGYRPNVFWLASAYFGMGRCYEILDQKAKAKDTYLKVSDEFPNTPYADQAQTFAQMIN